MADQETHEKLNRLYWESDESVAAIADRLDISRRALYDAIEPRPAGVPCPECGNPLGFRNRTAAENREAECPDCGKELELSEEPLDSPGREQELAAAPMAPTRRVPAADSGVLLAALLLIGLGIGALVAFLMRRR